jgi:hypothetical protein
MNYSEMKELYKLFAQGEKPKDIVKNKLIAYSRSNVYWHYSKYKKGITPFVFVK